MRTSLRLIAIVSVVLALVSSLRGQSAAPADLQTADLAWERGDYIAALNGYLALLNGPSAAGVLEPIALKTGELYRTEEITTDGLSPQFSRDARLVAYEVGAGLLVRTRIVSAAEGHAVVADVAGHGAVFSPAGDKVAYFRLQIGPELTGAQTAVDEASPQTRRMAQQQLAWLMQKHSTIVERDLATGRETELPTGGLLKTTLAYSADGSTVYVIGADEQENGRSEIYAVGAGARAPVKITGAPGMKSAMLIDPTGTVLVYDTTTRNPFRRPGPPQGGERPGEPGGPSDRPPSFGIVYLATGQTRVIEGRAPALSADGSTVAYLAREGTHNTVVVSKVFGTPVVVKKTTERVAAPAVSPDESRVAFQVMPWFDWEIVVVNSDGTGETRVTREDLVARVEVSLAAETALRARGRRMFEPIADDVRAVVAKASVARVFEHEKALFDFDSKHVSKPGNRMAAEYLFGQYSSYGYSPEY